MRARHIPYFHLIDFDGRQGAFENWSDRKAELFEQSLWGMTKHNSTFQCTVSVESAAHKRVKERMKAERLKPFQSVSDYVLCFKYLMFHTLDQLISHFDPDATLNVHVEEGPWSLKAGKAYHRAKGEGGYKPIPHAERMRGFSAFPKGEFRCLETADFVVGREHARLITGERAPPDRRVLSILLSEDRLEEWYALMLARKEEMRAHYRNQTRAAE